MRKKFLFCMSLMLLALAGCSQEKEFGNEAQVSVQPTMAGEETDNGILPTEEADEPALTKLQVGDKISKLQISSEVMDAIKLGVTTEEAVERVKTSILESFCLQVEEITEAEMQLRVISDYADTSFQIPYDAAVAPGAYGIELAYAQTWELEPRERMLMSVTLRAGEQAYSLGTMFVLTSETEQENIPCYFTVPYPNQYEITEFAKEEKELQDRYLAEYSALTEQSLYGELQCMTDAAHAEFRLGELGTSSEGYYGFMMFEGQEKVHYEIDENCMIVKLTGTENESFCYKVISAKSLQSYVREALLSNVYLMGVKDGKIIYMFNIFLS